MNLILIEPEQLQSGQVVIDDARQLVHIAQHIKPQCGDVLKVGIKNGRKGQARVSSISAAQLILHDLVLDQSPPAKIPLILVLALPRPKVLRRMVMDAVTLGVEKIVLIHSYRVEKSYWQSPLLQQIDDYVQLGLEQAGDTVVPSVELYPRFRPFVEDVLPQLLQGKRGIVAHPYAAQQMPVALAESCVLVVGAEGGFIPFEIELLAQNGCEARHIGERILRTETAVATLVGRLCV